MPEYQRPSGVGDDIAKVRNWRSEVRSQNVVENENQEPQWRPRLAPRPSDTLHLGFGVIGAGTEEAGFVEARMRWLCSDHQSRCCKASCRRSLWHAGERK